MAQRSERTKAMLAILLYLLLILSALFGCFWQFRQDHILARESDHQREMIPRLKLAVTQAATQYEQAVEQELDRLWQEELERLRNAEGPIEKVIVMSVPTPDLDVTECKAVQEASAKLDAAKYELSHTKAHAADQKIESTYARARGQVLLLPAILLSLFLPLMVVLARHRLW